MKNSSNYTIWGIFWRVVLLMWPIYLIQAAWWEGSLGKLIAAVVILLLVLWWAVSYAIKYYKQGQRRNEIASDHQHPIEDMDATYQAQQKKHNVIITVILVVFGLAVIGSVFGGHSRTATKSVSSIASQSNLPRGQQEALTAATNYLRTMPFSYRGLVDQMKYSGYSAEDVAFAVNNCGADWSEQALLKAKQYLETSAFSYKSLKDQLEFEKFTGEQARYAVDNCGADWEEQALLKAILYLETSAFSQIGLVEQLKFEGFTEDQALYGVNNCGADWNEQAAIKAASYMQYSSFSRSELIDQLKFEGFSHNQALYGVTANGY